MAINKVLKDFQVKTLDVLIFVGKRKDVTDFLFTVISYSYIWRVFVLLVSSETNNPVNIYQFDMFNHETCSKSLALS